MSNSAYKNGNITTLVELAKTGDIKAIEALVRREQKHIYAIFSHLTSKREDIADLTQEALLKMAKNIGKLKNPEHFRQWLNRIIANSFNDFTKKNKLNIVDFKENELEEIKDKIGCEPGERCIFMEIEKLIRLAMLALPLNLRLPLILREYQGMSYEDISKVTNSALGTVKSRISRARLRLREELNDFI